MRSVAEIKDGKGKKFLVRVDFNLPIKDGKVEDDFRVRKFLPTIEFLQKQGGKIIIISHMSKSSDTLAPVVDVLKKFTKAKFVPEVVGAKVNEAVEEMKDGEVLLLENLRNDPREKDCDEGFAKELAGLADIYINEAFPVDHREDASIILLPKLMPSYAGFQLEEEIKSLSKAFQNPPHPFLFILGGAKFSTKLPLIKKYLEVADTVFVGGALSNDFLQAKGYEVGKSLVSEESFGIEELQKSDKLVTPLDVMVKSGDKLINKKITDIGKDDIVLDIGEESIKSLETFIKEAKLILWNGPLGKYESGGGGSTKKILKLVAESGAETIIGGGDTVALISELHMEDKFSFVSTGGGATLDFLANGTLPGIEALKI